VGGRRVRRPQPKKKRLGCLLQFVVAAIAAIVLGYLMGTFLFSKQVSQQMAKEPNIAQQQPEQSAPEKQYNNTPDSLPKNKNDVQAETESVCVPELHLFQVQVGAFRQQANAEQLVHKLSVQGLPVELVPASNLIQVRAGLFFGRPAAEILKTQVSADGLQAMVVEKVITGKELCYSTGEQEYYEFAQALAGSLTEILLEAEEGRIQTAVEEMANLKQAARNVSFSANQRETVQAVLHGIDSNLAEAIKAPAEQKAGLVSQGIAVFVDWLQRI